MPAARPGLSAAGRGPASGRFGWRAGRADREAVNIAGARWIIRFPAWCKPLGKLPGQALGEREAEPSGPRHTTETCRWNRGRQLPGRDPRGRRRPSSPVTSMKIETHALGPEQVLIMLDGRLDIEGTAQIEVAFSAVSSHAKATLVDLSATPFVASIGIRLFISNAKALARRGGRLILFGAAPTVEEVLLTTGLGELATVVATRADADAALATLGAAS
ncbi:STAS domain-containing protein [Xanthobacter autotrophicus]|uniref:STAS domain-containing protein n=2 Tax=Xanthobacter autotrophicus TaxID=280 RepID=A0A6C1K9L5_XANAU|nr:STAS domain-containing protein [Xanthobacter autotrophicus]